MKKITYFAAATLAMAAMYASTATAAYVECQATGDRATGDRYVAVAGAKAGGYCYSQDKNIKDDEFAGLFGGIIEKDVYPAGNTTGFLTWTGNDTGTFSISASLWNMYDTLAIAFHFGGGSGTPDSFIVELDLLATSGTWLFLPANDANGLSNIYVLGKCENPNSPTDPTCKPDRDVPEPGTLGLLGLGLAGLGFGMRRRRKI